MSITRIASRYAKSLIDLAIEQNVLEDTYKDMKTLVEVVKENPELGLLLKSPIVKTDKKLVILKKLFEGKFSKISMEFMNIIVRKKREMYLFEVGKEYLAQYKRHKEILTAVITTAKGLDDDMRAKVKELLKQQTQQEVELVEKVDEDLIGGFILRVGDKQTDASIERRLRDMRKQFDRNPFIKDF